MNLYRQQIECGATSVVFIFSSKRIRDWLIVSDSTCKELGNCHSYPYNKEKAHKVKINNFSWVIIELSL